MFIELNHCRLMQLSNGVFVKHTHDHIKFTDQKRTQHHSNIQSEKQLKDIIIITTDRLST